MPDQERKGPTTSQTLGAVSDIAGAAGSIFGLDGIGASIAGITGGVSGAGKEATGDAPNPFGFMGGVSNAMSGILSLPGVSQADDILPDVYGGMGNAFGIITGVQDAADDTKSGADRVVGGIDAGANALGLGGSIGGASLTAAGSGVGGASTLLGSGAGAALTTGGAASMATAGGAVLGAGVAGYKIGGLINDAAGSDYARQTPGSVGGTHETYADWWLDKGAEVGGIGGMALGTAGATFGTIADAGVAAANWLFD